MERSGFFDANLVGEEYDRVYVAANFAAYFASFIGNGVFGGHSDELQVVANSTPDMHVVVSSGQGWILGYWYENTEDLILTVDVADGVLNRIDSIVLRLDYSNRSMYCAVKKGTPAVNPVAPSLTRNADAYELQLATVRINAGAINIQQANITDTRLNSEVCGFVVGLITQFDTTAFGIQLETFIADYIAAANAQYNDVWLTSLDALYASAQTAYNGYNSYLNATGGLKEQSDTDYESFLTWLASIKGDAVSDISEMLDELSGLISTEVAAALSQRITTLENLRPTVQIASFVHTLNKYPHVDLYEYDYGAGVQGFGEGVAGGGALVSGQLEYEMADMSHLVIRTRSGLGTVDTVEQVSERVWAVTFVNSIRCVGIYLRD